MASRPETGREFTDPHPHPNLELGNLATISLFKILESAVEPPPASPPSVPKEAGWVKARVISGRVCLFALYLQVQGTCLGMCSGRAQPFSKKGPDGEDASPRDPISSPLIPTPVPDCSHTRQNLVFSVL